MRFDVARCARVVIVTPSATNLFSALEDGKICDSCSFEADCHAEARKPGPNADYVVGGPLLHPLLVVQNRGVLLLPDEAAVLHGEYSAPREAPQLLSAP